MRKRIPTHRRAPHALWLGHLVLGAIAGCGSPSAGDEAPLASIEGAEQTEKSTEELAPAPPVQPFDIELDQPNMGSTFGVMVDANGNVVQKLTLSGLVSAPKVPIDIQAFNTTIFPAGWVTIATTNSSVVGKSINSPSELAYAWSIQINPPSTKLGPGKPWQPGGLLRLRAVARPVGVVDPGPPYAFDVDGPACWKAATTTVPYKSWVDAASQCQTVFGSGTAFPQVTIVSSELSPADNPDNPFPGPEEPLSQKPPFLSKPTYAFDDDPNNHGAAEAYYNNIGAPLTLAQFKSTYGFGASSEITATYYNRGDLGIGREMHCKTFGGGQACYVTNYARSTNFQNVQFGKDEDAALDAAIAHNASFAFATVAMVRLFYNGRMDFIVYDQNGNRSTKAKLDNTGKDTAVPNNCLTCHGARADDYQPGQSVPLSRATFLPFDPDPRNLVFKPSGPYSFASQATAIRDLNMLVYNSSVASDPGPIAAVRKLIRGIYGNESSATPGPTYTPNYVPAGWKGSPTSVKLYKEVVAPYCRTCHLTAPEVFQFNTYADFQNLGNAIANDVCDSSVSSQQTGGQPPFFFYDGHRMPHAEQTSRLFWAGPARAYLLGALGRSDVCDPG